MNETTTGEKAGQVTSMLMQSNRTIREARDASRTRLSARSSQEGWGTWDDGEQVVPAAPHAPGMALNQLSERDGQLLLHRTWLVHMTADAVQLCACQGPHPA